MHYVYILESIKTGRWYIGSASDVEKRLEQHNSGKTKSTKAYLPYKLIYRETYKIKSEARKREIQIKKSGAIRKDLKEKISIMAPSSNG